ncbi:zf-HC2 domain-containing protein, partial [Streptomyces celluloflavus]
MLCSRIRTALSARLDGEEPPPGHTARGLDGHLAACADCRDWEARARRLAALTAGRGGGGAPGPRGGPPPPGAPPGPARGRGRRHPPVRGGRHGPLTRRPRSGT